MAGKRVATARFLCRGLFVRPVNASTRRIFSPAGASDS